MDADTVMEKVKEEIKVLAPKLDTDSSYTKARIRYVWLMSHLEAASQSIEHNHFKSNFETALARRENEYWVVLVDRSIGGLAKE